ncbi:hypothetical protein IMCC9480_1375 [Oxalobacteraceae bacterium IMCC9480]|nr:hypothetical protein IMCC9480_1375 [Oxalobacteraceae bacterium IMCC9480]NDP60729.1 DUF3261 domain-containing protein [Oxalobacteraceae bacterium]
MHRRLILIALALLLAGCASLPPPAPPARLGLRLAPAALGERIAVQQHLQVERAGRIDELDAALEVDADQLQLVGLAFGQRVLTVAYDGRTLTSWRHPMLPAQVRADDVLEDIQLALWPLAAIRAALPPGWQIEDDGLRRTVSMHGVIFSVIEVSKLPRWQGNITLENRRYQYRLTIQSAPTSS